MSDTANITRLRNSPEFQQLGKLREEFNALSCFEDAFHENVSSRMLGYFLDSRKPHDLDIIPMTLFVAELFSATKCTVLQKFLKVLKPNFTRTLSVLEWGTVERRRLDILLEIQNHKNKVVAVLGIENKIGAGEQPYQVQAYQKAICSKFPSVPKAVVFLTPDAREPETGHSSTECPWIKCGYSTVIEFLRKLLPKAKGEIAVVVGSLLRFLDEQVMGTSKIQHDANALFEELYNDKVHRKAMILIRDLMPKSDVKLMYEGLIKDLRAKGQLKSLGNWKEQFLLNGRQPHATIWFVEEKDFSLGYMLHTRGSPVEIGKSATIRLMAWCETHSARRKLEKAFSKFDRGEYESAEWNKDKTKRFCPWFNIWTGNSYTLQDLSATDQKELKKLLISAVKETHARATKILKKL